MRGGDMETKRQGEGQTGRQGDRARREEKVGILYFRVR